MNSIALIDFPFFWFWSFLSHTRIGRNWMQKSLELIYHRKIKEQLLQIEELKGMR